MSGQIAVGEAQSQRDWLVHSMIGSKAHYWRLVQTSPIAKVWVSDCGLEAVSTDSVPMLDSGSFDHCARCASILGEKA